MEDKDCNEETKSHRQFIKYKDKLHIQQNTTHSFFNNLMNSSSKF